MYMGNDLSIEKKLKHVGNDGDMWEMAQICEKWLTYLTNGSSNCEMT